MVKSEEQEKIVDISVVACPLDLPKDNRSGFSLWKSKTLHLHSVHNVVFQTLSEEAEPEHIELLSESVGFVLGDPACSMRPGQNYHCLSQKQLATDYMKVMTRFLCGKLKQAAHSHIFCIALLVSRCYRELAKEIQVF